MTDFHLWPQWLATIEREARDLLRTDARSFRGRALLRAVQILRTLPTPVHWDDLEGIPGVGQGTLERLHHLADHPGMPADPAPAALPLELEDIYGLGPQRRRELQRLGVQTLEDLERYVHRHPDAVVDATHIFLRYRRDLQERIPLSESRQFETQVRSALARFPHLRWEMAGSYRRGLDSQADWDIVAAHPDPEQGMTRLVERLRRRGFELTAFGEGPRKWEGLVRGPSGKMRRLDIRMVPEESYAPALLYFTGSKEHNIRLRQKAKRKGWRLNEYALLDAQGRALPTPDEARIFALLGVPYVPPSERR